MGGGFGSGGMGGFGAGGGMIFFFLNIIFTRKKNSIKIFTFLGGGGAPSGATNHVVHMRGLPFRVTENDISEWFSSVVDPVSIDIQFNNQGRPTGEADVYFEKYVFYKCF